MKKRNEGHQRICLWIGGGLLALTHRIDFAIGASVRSIRPVAYAPHTLPAFFLLLGRRRSLISTLPAPFLQLAWWIQGEISLFQPG
jgi:hypothetical protein